MNKYMQEVLDWMWGKNSKRYVDIWSREALNHDKECRKVYLRCAPHITSDDLHDAANWIRDNFNGYGCMWYALQAFEQYYVIPAHEKQKLEEEQKND